MRRRQYDLQSISARIGRIIEGHRLNEDDESSHTNDSDFFTMYHASPRRSEHSHAQRSFQLGHSARLPSTTDSVGQPKEPEDLAVSFPSLSDNFIRIRCNSNSFERGRRILDNIVDVICTHHYPRLASRYRASVLGSMASQYTIHATANAQGTDVRASCTCPDTARGAWCKHIAAVLLHIRGQQVRLEDVPQGRLSRDIFTSTIQTVRKAGVQEAMARVSLKMREDIRKLQAIKDTIADSALALTALEGVQHSELRGMVAVIDKLTKLPPEVEHLKRVIKKQKHPKTSVVKSLSSDVECLSGFFHSRYEPRTDRGKIIPPITSIIEISDDDESEDIK